jgi:DNA end-binding protein Ku
MRSMWKGTVSFGLVSIAVKLYRATEDRAVRFHQLHAADGSRIRYKRTCAGCGDEVDYDHLAKGYELGGGDMVVLTDDDLADLPLSSTHTIDVLEFVPAEQIDPIMYAGAYYLEPDGAALKPYVLLRDALTRMRRVAIVKVALRGREQLATMRVRGNVLLLNTMLWPDELREPAFPFLGADVEARPAELALAGSLIESMATDFDPSRHTDTYRAALEALIEAKVAGRELVPAEGNGAAPTVATDLMAALRASVERARAARAEPTPTRETRRKPAARRAATPAAGAAATPKRVARAEPAAAKTHRKKKASAGKAASHSSS